MGLFNTDRIDSLEQSVATLTEGLEKTNNTISGIFENLTEIAENIQNLTGSFEDNKKKLTALEDTTFSFIDGISKDLDTKIQDRIETVRKSMQELEQKLKNMVQNLEKKSDSSDEIHNNEIASLKQSIDALVTKCEELQNDNKELIRQHNEIVTRYEESIKGYREQTEHMKNNILKKMNMDNVFTVKEG